MDVEKAFLQSRQLERDVYINPPKEATGRNRSRAWKLKTAVYGLGDATREWYLTVKKVLKELGLQESKLEPSLFFKTSSKGHLEEIFCLHVDDIYAAGNRSFKAILEMFKERVRVGKHKKGEFTLCGMKFFQDRASRVIHVSVDPAKLNQMAAIAVRGPPDRMLTESEETQARSLIGTLQWFASICRPDLAYSLGQALSFANRERKVAVFDMINAIISKFAKYRQNRLSFQPLNKPVKLEIYGDTSLDGENQQGLLTLMRANNSRTVNVISWRSKMSDRKAWSTLSGEARVMQHAIDKAVHLKALSTELGFRVEKTTVLTDNLSLRRVVESGRPTQEQSLRRDIAIIRDQIVYSGVEVRFVKSPAMLADHLTKERSGNILKDNKFMDIEKFDTKQVTAKEIRDAAIDIPLEEEEKFLHVDVDALFEIIGAPEEQTGRDQEEATQVLSLASNTDDEQLQKTRTLTFGRKSASDQGPSGEES